ncbi:MAG: glutamate 5-kinase [Clostridia bacterium]|nr:glutamate 5-kinase [Clostridia bacterium]
MIVVKVGTSTLTHSTGKLDLRQMEKLVRDLADLANQGKKPVLVSSGAVGAGLGRLGFTKRPRTLREKQAIAAVGQGILLQMYEKLFAEYGRVVAQVLLTRDDFSDRRRYLNVSHTFSQLLEYDVIPIINENDTTAVEELKFGDNDSLAALVAGALDADLLIILSDIDGLYSDNPKLNPQAERIGIVKEITPEIEALAGGAGSTLGTGGMSAKIQAAKICTNSGIPMVIANGSEEGVLHRIVDGHEVGTTFLPQENKLRGKKKWIAYGSAIQGKVVIDRGAAKALLSEGKSLLPIGIIQVSGNYDAGAVVSVFDPDGQELARGITNYSAAELDLIKGKKSGEIEDILGQKDYDEAIHRDNMALWENGGSERS